MSKKEISDLEKLSIEEFKKRIGRSHALIAEIETQLPGMTTLTSAERLTSDGKLGTNESAMLGVVLDAVEISPHYFSSLADQDDGVDPNQFETELLRERLARRDALHTIAQDLEALVKRVNDTVMHLGSRVRRPVLAAYQIGKSVAKSDAILRKNLAPAFDYYSRSVKRAVKTRANKKKAS